MCNKIKVPTAVESVPETTIEQEISEYDNQIQVDGDDSAGTLTVTVELLSNDDTGKVEDYKSYAFPYIIESGAVRFTDFPAVR